MASGPGPKMQHDVNKIAMESFRTRSARPWSSRRGARHAAEALRIQETPADRAFDRFLPNDLRTVSVITGRRFE